MQHLLTGAAACALAAGLLPNPCAAATMSLLDAYGNTLVVSDVGVAGAAYIEVKLTFGEGTPAPGREVALVAPGSSAETQPQQQAITDEQGSLMFDPVKPGTYSIRVLAQDESVQIAARVISEESALDEYRRPPFAGFPQSVFFFGSAALVGTGTWLVLDDSALDDSGGGDEQTPDTPPEPPPGPPGPPEPPQTPTVPEAPPAPPQPPQPMSPS